MNKDKILVISGLLNGFGGEEKLIERMLENKNYNDNINFVLLTTRIGGEKLHHLKVKKNVKLHSCSNNVILKNLLVIWHLVTFRGNKIICFSPFSIFLSSLVKKMFKRKYLIYSWIQFQISKKYSMLLS